MKIRFATSTSVPYGQFVIEAESESDQAVMACFLAPATGLSETKGWRFRLHGWGTKQPFGGISSFNIGWDRPPEPKPEGQ